MKCTICGAETTVGSFPRIAGTRKRVRKLVPRCLKHIGSVKR